MKRADVELLKGRLPVLAIKKNVEHAPWAEVVYGCDYPWWRSVRGLPDYRGLKLAWADKAVTEYGCRKVEIPNILETGDRLLFGQTGHVGAGGNSGFHALNLAVQFGATRVLLLGFDMQGQHWYGRNNWSGGNNPSDSNFRRWIKAFDVAGGQLEERGIEVVNASPVSHVKRFRRLSLTDALEAWGLLARSGSAGIREKLLVTP